MGYAGFPALYFAQDAAAGLTTIIFSIVPTPLAERLHDTVTIGASGAIYGLLLAYGLAFPNRPIYVYFVFPIPASTSS